MKSNQSQPAFCSSSGNGAEPGGPAAGQEGVGGGGESTLPPNAASLSPVFVLKPSACFQEAKAIIAQRSDNPREFFKNKERAMVTSVDTSPVSIHRTGKRTAALRFILGGGDYATVDREV